MFNVKSLKKFTVISASALMLLSVGGGAVGASHANVHADSAEIARLKAEGANLNNDEPALNKQANAYDKADGGETPQQENKQYNQLAKQRKARAKVAHKVVIPKVHKATKHIVKKHAKRAVVRRHHANRKANVRKVAKAKRQMKRAKRQLNRKNKAKKHVRRHAKRQSLQQQINSLKREMRSLQNQINRFEKGYRK